MFLEKLRDLKKLSNTKNVSFYKLTIMTIYNIPAIIMRSYYNKKIS